MTCIAGVEQRGKVWIGGDSAGVEGWSLTVRADEKVFRKGPFVCGFTTSFRMGDLLRYAFSPPEQSIKQGDREYLCTTWVDALRECFAAGGFKKTEHGVEEGGDFLLGYAGSLYRVTDDYQVGRPANGYDAVGCGMDIARGALHATKGEPRRRVLAALHAAQEHSAGVRGPFKVVSV